jgi:hypothetical protein
MGFHFEKQKNNLRLALIASTNTGMNFFLSLGLHGFTICTIVKVKFNLCVVMPWNKFDMQ